MRILSRVCARFEHPQDRSVVFQIRPADRLILMDVPEWLQKVQLFQWLVSDGSIEVVHADNKVMLENNPTDGISAEGKKAEITQAAEATETPLESSEVVGEEKPKRTRRKALKTTQSETEV